MAKRPSTPAEDAPKHLTKQQFAKNLYQAMSAKGWIPAQLARQTGIAPDSISYYLSGRNMPGPANAQKLADALGVTVARLIPSNILTVHEREGTPDIEMKVTPNGRAWLLIQKVVTLETATRIIELIKTDAKH